MPTPWPQVLPTIRRHIRLPVGVGFGIRDGASAKAVARSADAVVIGSALVQLMAAQTRENAVSAGAGFIREIRAALDTLMEGTPS